jgi:uncharacterized BrkB/YihY/UPF0761 family membrane protein
VVETPPPEQTSPPSPGRWERLRQQTDRLTERSLHRLELERERRESVRIAFDFYRRDRAYAGSLLAGGLAVKLFVWFLPFSLAAVLVLGLLGDQIDRDASDLASDAGLTAALAGVVEDAVSTTERGRIYLGVLAVALLLWTGLGVARALRLVSRLSWNVASPTGVNPLAATLSVLGFWLGLGILQWLLRLVQRGPLALDVLGVVMVAGLLVVMFTVALNALPHPVGVGWRAMVPGAVLATTAILVTRLVTIVYFAPRLESADDLYGGLGTASVFLAWLYIIGRIVVAAIALNATLHLRGEATPSPLADGLEG